MQPMLESPKTKDLREEKKHQFSINAEPHVSRLSKIKCFQQYAAFLKRLFHLMVRDCVYARLLMCGSYVYTPSFRFRRSVCVTVIVRSFFIYVYLKLVHSNDTKDLARSCAHYITGERTNVLQPKCFFSFGEYMRCECVLWYFSSSSFHWVDLLCFVLLILFVASFLRFILFILPLVWRTAHRVLRHHTRWFCFHIHTHTHPCIRSSYSRVCIVYSIHYT